MAAPDSMMNDPYSHNWNGLNVCMDCGQHNWIDQIAQCRDCLMSNRGCCSEHWMEPCKASQRRKRSGGKAT